MSFRKDRTDAGRELPYITLPRPAVMVVAHPDDEVLWLSSVIDSVDHVVFCFGDAFNSPREAEARRRALAALPLNAALNLAIPESGAGFSVDWARPKVTQTGIAIRETDARARYDTNYSRLVESLRPVLNGVRSVCTHNPWGEYGHAEHIQVFRAIASLQAELGYTVWFTNYVGRASWALARQVGQCLCWDDRLILPPNVSMAHKLRKVYAAHGAWTWTQAHRWPPHETIYAVAPPGSHKAQNSLVGERLLDVAILRWWPLPWRLGHRRLR